MSKLKHTTFPAVKLSFYGPENLEMSIGDRIKERRIELGLTVHDVAAAVRVTVQAVYQWESGSSKAPACENIVDVADCLRTTVRWLTKGRGARERGGEGGSLAADEAELLRLYGALPDDGKAAVRSITRQLVKAAQGRKRSG